MKALFFCLSIFFWYSGLASPDSLRAAYWERYWERDYSGMLELVDPDSEKTESDIYRASLLANALALNGRSEDAMQLIESRGLLAAEDDDAWLLAAYALQCVYQDLDKPAAQLSHEREVEAQLSRRNPGLHELYVFTNNLARSFYERGDPLGALRQIERLRDHPDFVFSDRIRGRALEKAAIIAWSIGKYDEARQDMEQAVDIHRKLTPEPDFYLAQLTNNLGVICNAQGDLAKAIQLYEIAKEYYLAFEGEDSHWVNVSHSNLGRAYRDLGNLPDAEAQFRKRQEILERNDGTPFQLFENAHYMAIVLYEQGKSAEADSCVSEMEELLNGHFPEDGIRKADLFTLKSRLALQAGDAETAIEAAHASRSSFAHQGVTEAPLLTRNYLVLSEAAERLNVPDSARIYAERAVSPYARLEAGRWSVIRSGKECFEPLTRLASLHSRNGNQETAEELFALTISTLDEVRLNLDDPASRRFVYSEASKVFFEYLDHLQRHRPVDDGLEAQILATIEGAKAFNLRLAQSQRSMKQRGIIPDSLALEENNLLQAISRLNEKQKSLEDYIRLDALRLELDSLRVSLRSAYPEAYQRSRLLEAPGLEFIREQLDPGTAYITLLLGEDQHWVGLVTGDNLVVHRVDFPGLQDRIITYARAFQTPEGAFDTSEGLRDIQEAGREIFEALFSEFSLNGLDHLIFSPSGSFGQLNPGLLIRGDVTDDLASIPFLIRDYSISTRWTWNSDLKQKPAASRAAVFASSPAGIRKIEAAMEEAEMIARLTGGSSYIGQTCTETGFTEGQGGFGLLHLATHGIVADEPWGTYLEFNADSVSDGRLNLIEIAGLDLTAQHITLSACRSAQSRWQTGEAFGSLAVGFSEAGCPSLTASLWDAPDRATSEIMEVYYEGLVQGLKKSDALRKAQLAFLDNQQDPLKTHPYFWGGFIQIGEDSPIVFGKNETWSWWWLLLLPVALYGLQYFIRKRRTAV